MLPEWIKELRPGVYEVDPDAYYPGVLEELGVSEPTQYDLEVAHNWLKLDAQLAVRQAGHRGSVTLIVRGGDGYKERWGWRGKHAGRHQELRDGGDESAYARRVAAEAREHYRQVRGFLPA